MAEPLISVVMPVYNALPYLRQALDSMLGQTLAGFELLIFDDGSTDGSLDVLDSYATRDRRIRLFKESHAGYTVWLNKGLQLSRSRYYARMDADDVAHPERLALQVAYLAAHPDCVAVGADVQYIDSDGWPITRLHVPTSHEQIVDQLLRGRGHALVHPLAMFPHEALLRVGGYRAEYETAEDLDLYLRLSQIGRLANLPQVLLQYRRHAYSVGSRNGQRQAQAVLAVLREAHERLGIAGPPRFYRPPDIDFPLSASHLNWSVRALRGGHVLTAAKHAVATVRTGPASAVSFYVRRFAAQVRGRRDG
jgi:glycosyltransferase involved in cell wall biosynthesis